MSIEIRFAENYSVNSEAYLIGYNDKKIVNSPLTKELEKRFGVSFLNLLHTKNIIEENKEFYEFSLLSKKEALTILFIPLDSDYHKMQGKIMKGIQNLQGNVSSVLVDGEVLFQKTDLNKNEALYRLVESLNLATYRFDQYKSKKKKILLKRIEILGFTGKESEKTKAKALIISKAVKNVRDFVNIPAMDVNPAAFISKAKEIAKENPSLSIEVLDVKEMKKKKMNALLAVGQGSDNSPACIVLTYKGAPKNKKTIGWIGKGVTFDSGGLDLKPPDGMLTMKCDMAGGATVLFATEAVAKLSLPVNIITVIPCVENMPSGKAYRPGDVLTAMNGKTIEVGNTDAEGRLILADALVLAAEKKVTHFIDVATLTGACVVALGEVASGLCSNDANFAKELVQAGEMEGEKIWEMPLFEEYRKLIDSDVADIKNTGGRFAGMITAALFLREFVPEKAPWCHLDVAGTAYRSAPLGMTPKGGTGEPMRTLVRWAEEYF